MDQSEQFLTQDDQEKKERERQIHQKYNKTCKSKEIALKKAPVCEGSYFNVIKTASGVVLKCVCCDGTISAVNPTVSMPRHLGSANCPGIAGKRAKDAIAEAAKKLEAARNAHLTEEEVAVLAEVSDNKKRKPNALTSSVVRMPQTAAELFKEKVMEWAIVNCHSISFNVMSDPLLAEAFASIGISSGIDRKRLSGSYLQNRYEAAVATRAEIVQASKGFQVGGDAWTSQHCNNGFKILGATLNFSEGGSILGDIHGSAGEIINNEYLLDFYGDVIEANGPDKYGGLVADGEAAYQLCGRKLEERYYWSNSIRCQAHSLDSLLKDFGANDPLATWTVDGCHSVLVFVNSHKDVRATLREAQEVFYDHIQSVSVGCETRFATSSKELRDLLKNKEALQGLLVVPELQQKYAAGPSASEASKAAWALIVNENFWSIAQQYYELFSAFGDVIHHIEGDMPTVSQMPRIWARAEAFLQRWCEKYRKVDEQGEVQLEWNCGFAVPTAKPASPKVLQDLLLERKRRSYHPCFTAAALLDLRFLVEVDDSYVPDLSYVDPAAKQAAVEVMKRMAGPENAEDLEMEFMMYVTHGTSALRPMQKLHEKVSAEGEKVAAPVKLMVTMWKAYLRPEYPILYEIAKRLLSLHPTSCSTERLWSQARWLYRPSRTRLGIEKAKKMLLIGSVVKYERRNLKGEFEKETEAMAERFFDAI